MDEHIRKISNSCLLIVGEKIVVTEEIGKDI